MTRSVDPALLEALSTELGSLVAPVEGLAELIADHARGAKVADRSSVLQQGQAVDEVSQTLWALSRLLGALARGETAESALRDLPLSALAARLSPDAVHIASTPVQGAGDFQLFD